MQHYKFNNDFLQNLLNKIQTEKKFCVLAGDFNLNLIKYSKTTGINQFLEIILSHNFMPQITLPARVTGRTATRIDNILINSYKNKCTSGSITTSVSDHLPQFLIIENFKGQTYKIKIPKVAIRDYKNFNSESFQSDIKEIDWSLATENNDVDLGIETFFKLFSRTLDKYAPYKEIRKKNEIETLKPWITKGVKQSIKVRDRLYKDVTKTKNIQLRQIKEKSFKKYRNKIVDLIKINRK